MAQQNYIPGPDGNPIYLYCAATCRTWGKHYCTSIRPGTVSRDGIIAIRLEERGLPQRG